MMNEGHASGGDEVFTDGSVPFSMQPQTLQQEFALINKNIPNVIVEQVGVSLNCLEIAIFPLVNSRFHLYHTPNS